MAETNDDKKEYPKAIYDKSKHEGGKLIAIVNSKEEEDALTKPKGWGKPNNDKGKTDGQGQGQS